MSGDRAALGANIKREREYRGFSQDEVARYLGISRSAVSLIESGDRKLEALELKKLADLFKCSMTEFTGTTYTNAESESVKLIARATAELTPEDRDEVLRFAEFLRTRRKSEGPDG